MLPKRKSEVRIDRKNKKALQAQKKSARLVEAYISEHEEKDVRIGADPGSVFHMTAVIKCDDPDVEESWSWGVDRKWDDQEWLENIEPKLNEWKKLTWAEIDEPTSDTGHKMHHNMNRDDICEEAQYRLVKIEKFFDVLFRFRLGNLPRLWGYRIVNTFHVIWYDPTHQIYPTDD